MPAPTNKTMGPSRTMNLKHIDHYATDQARWEALVQRDDPLADGAFFYAVKTTGVYCRPGCPSRLPNRENVQFFGTPGQAEDAGFRPCKRCTPRETTRLDPQRKWVLQVCQILEQAENPPTLSDLAHAVGLSPSHLHRTFKRLVGVTPKQYALEVRRKRVRNNLEQTSSVTDAIQQTGYGSSSRFYENDAGALGMRPATYQKKGRGARIRYAVGRCDLGWVLVAATEQGICAIDLGDREQDLVAGLHERFSEAEWVTSDAPLAAWMERILSLLESPREGLDLPLDIQGTAFQRRVWAALKGIAPGTTASYAQVAARIGQPRASRAVAQACASNPVAVAIPCHRVVRSDGGLGGYRWGEKRKRALLDREQRETHS